MATRTIITDDLDGTEAWRTIRFGFDGRLFEIDLSREHVESFKHGLTPWMEAGREVSKFSSVKPGGTEGTSKYRQGLENKKIREWGREQGMQVPDIGPLPQPLLVAYRLRHDAPQSA